MKAKLGSLDFIITILLCYCTILVQRRVLIRSVKAPDLYFGKSLLTTVWRGD